MQFDQMKRREFITVLGGAAAAWPLAARAQQPDRMRRIGVLMNLAADDVEGQQRLAAFLQGLQEAGWEVGRNVRIDIRSTGDIKLNSKYAMELLALALDVFLAAGAPTVRALQKATRTVPIVFTSSADPVGAGLVASLGRPSGNATGFSSFEYSIGGKWLEFLKQIAPTVTRVAVVRDPDVPAGIGQFGAIQAVAPYVGVELRPIDTRDSSEIEQAMNVFTRQTGGGLIVTQNTSVLFHRNGVSVLAAKASTMTTRSCSHPRSRAHPARVPAQAAARSVCADVPRTLTRTRGYWDHPSDSQLTAGAFGGGAASRRVAGSRYPPCGSPSRSRSGRAAAAPASPSLGTTACQSRS